MLFKDDETPENPAAVIDIFTGTIYDTCRLANLKWFNAEKIIKGECNIIDINDAHFRPSKLSWRNTEYDNKFQYPGESGLWITAELRSTIFSIHFNCRQRSDECCVWFPDEELFTIYKEFLNTDPFHDKIKLSDNLWIEKSIPKLTVYLWFEHFEGFHTMNYGTKHRMKIAGNKYSDLSPEKVESVFNICSG